MRGIDKATGRVIALIVLLVLTAASLRGYVPTAQRASREQAGDNPAALAGIAVLLAASLMIVAFAIIARARNRRVVASSIGELSTRPGGDKRRPSWRVLLIALAVLIAWLLLVWLLSRFVWQHHVDQLAPDTGNADTPATGAAPPRPPQRQERNTGGNVLGYLAVAATGMLLLIFASIVTGRRTQRRESQPPRSADERPREAVTTDSQQSLVRAAELGLAEIGDLSREPREAIIGCYVAMERELARVPGAVPQDFDTPTEVLARAVAHHALPAANATQLVNLFAEARFSAHLMTEEHREDAVRILRLVLAELRTPA
jgi:cytoskeletal protein RodZ